jgi:hypothetical protein
VRKLLVENARQAVSNIAAFQSVDLDAQINLTMKRVLNQLAHFGFLDFSNFYEY